jgi:hypothetical protein
MVETEYQKKYRYDNRHHIANRVRQYQKKRKEELREYHKNYYLEVTKKQRIIKRIMKRLFK